MMCIGDLLKELLRRGVLLKDTCDHQLPPMLPPSIGEACKGDEAQLHQGFLDTPPKARILLYTDGRKREDSQMRSAWHFLNQDRTGRTTTLFEGYCAIGKHADIEDREVHTI